MAKQELTISQKKAWAKSIFLNPRENKTQKEIAQEVGVREATLSKWVKEWEHLKLNLLQTREERYIATLIQLRNLDDEIAKVGYPDSKQSDIRRKLVADLNDLEQEADIRTISNVSQGVLAYLKPINAEQAALVGSILNDYVKHLLTKKGNG